MERISIFIDGANLHYGLKDVCQQTDLDLSRFVDWLVNGRKLIRTYYYNAAISTRQDPERARRQQQFFERLRHIPYFDVRLGRLEARRGTFVEKGVDVRLAVDMLSMAMRDIYDTAILVSSDGDFAEVINAVRDTGKHVEVACFLKAYRVREAADKVIDLTATSLRSCFLS